MHSLSGASLGHFLKYDNLPEKDQIALWQVEKTFNYLAHSFLYWARALYEASVLAPGARLLGLTNALEHQMLHNCGLIGAAKAALEQYVMFKRVCEAEETCTWCQQRGLIKSARPVGNSGPSSSEHL